MTTKIIPDSDIQLNTETSKATATPSAMVCKYCQKTFRAPSIFTRHQLEQLCRPLNSRTYCKSCNYTGENKQAYENHILSRDHLNKLCGVKVDPVQINARSVFDLDPYLTKSEAQKIRHGVEDIGDKFVVHFKDNTIQCLATETNIKPKADKTEVAIATYEKANSTCDYQALLRAHESRPAPTERQTKIIAWLAKWQNDGVAVMKDKIRTILEKIGMEDADYLINHIRDSSQLTLDAKQFYAGYVDTLVSVLIGRINNGQTQFGGKDIFNFVAKLTK